MLQFTDYFQRGKGSTVLHRLPWGEEGSVVNRQLRREIGVVVNELIWGRVSSKRSAMGQRE